MSHSSATGNVVPGWSKSVKDCSCRSSSRPFLYLLVANCRATHELSRHRQALCSVGVFGWCVRLLCSVGVFSCCVRLVCSVGVFGWCVRLVCSVGVFGWCVRLVCSVAVFGCCVQLLCSVAVVSCCGSVTQCRRSLRTTQCSMVRRQDFRPQRNSAAGKTVNN